MAFSMAFFKALPVLTILFMAFGLVAPPADALEYPETELAQAGLSTALGTQLDLNIQLTDSNGVARTLGELLNPNRPSIVLPVYFDCPRMCGLVTQGFANALGKLALKLGRDFDVFTVSFDSDETYQKAAESAAQFRKQAPDPLSAAAHWHFLVGDQNNVRKLMAQLGFHYFRDKDEWAHSPALMLLTPNGQISQYFTGVEFSAPDLRLALVEASQGRIGSLLDHVALFCFRFDQRMGKYTWTAFSIMRAGGALTLIGLGGLLVYLWRRERVKRVV